MRLGLVDFGGIGHALGWLRLRGERFYMRQDLDDFFTAQRGQGRVQIARSVMRCNLKRGAGQNRAGIQPCFHLHDANAGLRIACHDRALNGGRPAPARQKRGVDIQTAKARRIQHGLRQDQPIGDDHGNIGIQRGKFGQSFGVAQQFGRI